MRKDEAWAQFLSLCHTAHERNLVPIENCLWRLTVQNRSLGAVYFVSAYTALMPHHFVGSILAALDTCEPDVVVIDNGLRRRSVTKLKSVEGCGTKDLVRVTFYDQFDGVRATDRIMDTNSYVGPAFFFSRNAEGDLEIAKVAFTKCGVRHYGKYVTDSFHYAETSVVLS